MFSTMINAVSGVLLAMTMMSPQTLSTEPTDDGWISISPVFSVESIKEYAFQIDDDKYTYWKNEDGKLMMVCEYKEGHGLTLNA